MPLRVMATYTFLCDDCGAEAEVVLDECGRSPTVVPAAPRGWVCDWGTYLCPVCKEHTPS